MKNKFTKVSGIFMRKHSEICRIHTLKYHYEFHINMQSI